MLLGLAAVVSPSSIVAQANPAVTHTLTAVVPALIATTVRADTSRHEGPPQIRVRTNLARSMVALVSETRSKEGRIVRYTIVTQ